MLSNDDLSAFAALATSQESIDGLLTVNCGGVGDGSDTVRVEVGPDIFLDQQHGMPIRADRRSGGQFARLEVHLHGGPTDAGVPAASAPGRIDWSKLGFDSVTLDAPSGPRGFVLSNGTINAASSYGTYVSAALDPATFEELKRHATSVDLVRALPGNCEPPTSDAMLTVDLTPSTVVGLGGEPSIRFHMGIAGCAEGPITALKALLIPRCFNRCRPVEARTQFP